MPHGAITIGYPCGAMQIKTERLKMQSLGCFAYDSEVSAVLII